MLDLVLLARSDDPGIEAIFAVVAAFVILVWMIGWISEGSKVEEARRLIVRGHHHAAATMLRSVSFRDTRELQLFLAERMSLDGHTGAALGIVQSLRAKLRRVSEPTRATVAMIERAAALEERIRQRALATLREAKRDLEGARDGADADDGGDRAADARPHPRRGQRVGRYVLDRLVAEGGFGEVWRARDGDRVVALKIPTHPGYVEHIRAQGHVQRRLHDPRIVSVIELDVRGATPFVAMEYVAGEDLRAILRREGRLPVGRALAIFEEVVRAVKAAHEADVVHRDLKPGNVLVGPGDRVKVTDFELGAAREKAERPLERSRGLETAVADAALAGTPAYMAPEQLAGEAVDRRADIWALGMILFEMLTGRRPQPGDRIGDFVEGAPASCEAAFARCYTRLEKRFRSADELLAAIARAPAPERTTAGL